MSDRFGRGEGSQSKADGLAIAINRCIQELVIKCSKDMEVLKYYEVGVIGYGYRIGSALSSSLTGKPLVWIDELYQNPLRVDVIEKMVSDGAGGLVPTTVKLPVWLESVSSGGTPMNTAFQNAYSLLVDWVQAHPTAFPPIVINFSDGEPTDGDPSDTARKLMDLSTEDGNVLVLNAHLSSSRAAPIIFPDSDANLPDQYARLLFGISSVLPDFMRVTATEYGFATSEQSRGFVFNAEIEQVIGFLNIGTRPSNLR
jgi:uncharacterized protein YegL